MYCARDKRSRGAFTLLEVVLAVMIMALVAFAIYRFVFTSLEAIRISTENSNHKRSAEALVAVIAAEFCRLPPSEPNALLGEAHQFNGKASDQVTWLGQAGNGLFTGAAKGEWKVTLILKPDNTGNTYTLGLLRQVPDNRNKDEHWVPLLPRTDAIEIRYFDPTHTNWVDRWTDPQNRPALVRVRIWRDGESLPFESVIELPIVKLPT
jgi:type II secretory pathway pseudopilin PulG